jgi:A/G-specific adenine glycosylase
VKSKTIPHFKNYKIKPLINSNKYLKDVKSLATCKEKIEAWYFKNSRQLPWRKTNPNPYEIWISEIMLQQSTVATVISYFQKWMKLFPTVEDLCNASSEQVLKVWQGLGYYQRVRNLHRAAQMLKMHLSKHHEWPQTVQDWEKFPGIGPYTAAAICAIAFKQKELPVDGNVYRCFSRFWLIKDPLNNSLDRDSILIRFKNFAQILEKDKHPHFAQAFMEIGALICRPQKPLCELCPLNSQCLAFKKNSQESLPLKKIKKASVKLFGLALVYHRPNHSHLVRKIPQGKHLEGQWEIPIWYLEEAELKSLMPGIQRNFELLNPVKHSITHHRYTVWPVLAGAWDAKDKIPSGHMFINEQNETVTLSTLSRKILIEVEKARI